MVAVGVRRCSLTACPSVTAPITRPDSPLGGRLPCGPAAFRPRVPRRIIAAVAQTALVARVASLHVARFRPTLPPRLAVMARLRPALPLVISQLTGAVSVGLACIARVLPFLLDAALRPPRRPFARQTSTRAAQMAAVARRLTGKARPPIFERQRPTSPAVRRPRCRIRRRAGSPRSQTCRAVVI